jgi:hypothetical protein
MPNPIVLEISASDDSKAHKFCRAFSVENRRRQSDESGSSTRQAGDQRRIFKAPKGVPFLTFYVMVDDLHARLKRSSSTAARRSARRTFQVSDSRRSSKIPTPDRRLLTARRDVSRSRRSRPLRSRPALSSSIDTRLRVGHETELLMAGLLQYRLFGRTFGGFCPTKSRSFHMSSPDPICLYDRPGRLSGA